MQSFFAAVRRWISRAEAVVYGSALWHVKAVELLAQDGKTDGEWTFRAEFVEEVVGKVVEVHE
ncbi:MAG: hypothetical protein Q4D38_11675 [Planctomycetia bacterium]|nr:hypothetical protein [Planctomycetia bacterium]